MPRLLATIATCLLVITPTCADAWGFEAHMFIMDRAIALLPDELRPLFEKNRAMVVEHAIDPDTWRTFYDQESPNHFVNLDWEGYGPYPFAGLPRDYAVAVAKFGKERIAENGTLPWRAEELHGKLRDAFTAYSRRGPFGRFDIMLNSAFLAHYISDAHVPLHAVVNSDGQSTNQRGIHIRFEASLFERYRNRLKVAPARLAPIRNPRDFAFDALAEGTRLVPSLLKADAEAIGAGDVYGDAYDATMSRLIGPMLERRVNESIAAVAAMITGAWETAGKPPVPTNPPEPLQRRSR